MVLVLVLVLVVVVVVVFSVAAAAVNAAVAGWLFQHHRCGLTWLCSFHTGHLSAVNLIARFCF